MKVAVIFAVAFVASVAVAANNNDDFSFIRNIDKAFGDCSALRETVRAKCPGLIPEPDCLACVLKGCYSSLTQDNFCKNLNQCAAKNPAKC